MSKRPTDDECGRLKVAELGQKPSQRSGTGSNRRRIRKLEVGRRRPALASAGELPLPRPRWNFDLSPAPMNSRNRPASPPGPFEFQCDC